MNYRSSHTAANKGENYDISFELSDYRQFILDWEIKVLNKIVSETLVNRDNYLDFACGTGRITKILEPFFLSSYGIDVSKSMLKEAESKLNKTILIEQDITEDNPFEANQMDLISSFRFFLNAEEDLRTEVLKQLHNILSPTGYLVFNIHNNKTFINRVIDRLAIAKKKLNGERFIPQKSFSIKETERLLKENKFETVKLYHRVLIPIKSENTRFKISRFKNLEDFFSNKNGFKYLSRNIIYVCRKVSQ